MKVSYIILRNPSILYLTSPAEFIESFDGQFYICKTCDKRIKKGVIHREAVPNKLEVYDFPEDLKNIRRLERVLIGYFLRKYILRRKVKVQR